VRMGGHGTVSFCEFHSLRPFSRAKPRLICWPLLRRNGDMRLSQVRYRPESMRIGAKRSRFTTQSTQSHFGGCSSVNSG
jgi:hypothetical protein